MVLEWRWKREREREKLMDVARARTVSFPFSWQSCGAVKSPSLFPMSTLLLLPLTAAHTPVLTALEQAVDRLLYHHSLAPHVGRFKRSFFIYRQVRNNSLLEQLVHTHALVLSTFHHLGHRQLKVLVRDMNTTLAQRVHTGLRAHTLDLSAA